MKEKSLFTKIKGFEERVTLADLRIHVEKTHIVTGLRPFLSGYEYES